MTTLTSPRPARWEQAEPDNDLDHWGDHDPADIVIAKNYNIRTLAEMLADATPSWHARAACRGKGPRIFFDNPIAAKLICANCPVIDQCLDHAVERHEHGTWGGTGERQRVTIRRERKAR